MGLRLICWDHKPDAVGKCPIKIYVYRDGEKKYLGTDTVIDPDDWNPKSCRVKSSHPNEAAINRKLSEAFNKIERIMMDHPNERLDGLIELYGAGGGKTLIEFAKWFIKECEEGRIKRESSTIQTYRSTLFHIEEYHKIRRFDFATISRGLYEGWVAHLRAVPLMENTVGNKVKTLLTFINQAKSRKITTITEHENDYFTKPSEEVDTIYLTEKEMEAIVNIKNLPSHLEAERDRFLISTFFLLRYSDSVTIAKENFFEDGRLFYRGRAIKTGNEVIIPVKQIAYDILKKNDFSFKSDTNPEANWKLKEIGDLAKIKTPTIYRGDVYPKHKLITTHTARRTGASNMYLADIPVPLIMALGGWKTEKSFRTYVRVGKLELAKKAAALDYFK